MSGFIARLVEYMNTHCGLCGRPNAECPPERDPEDCYREHIEATYRRLAARPPAVERCSQRYEHDA